MIPVYVMQKPLSLKEKLMDGVAGGLKEVVTLVAALAAFEILRRTMDYCTGYKICYNQIFERNPDLQLFEGNRNKALFDKKIGNFLNVPDRKNVVTLLEALPVIRLKSNKSPSSLELL